jgi:hypothetical protein
VVVHDDDDRGVAQAVTVADEDDRWTTPNESANTMITIGELLRRDAEACATDHSPGAPECKPFFAGSAHAQAGSVGLLRCTRVELFDAREAMRSYLSVLASDAPHARLPDLPYCV